MRKILVALATLLFAGSVHAATLPYGGALVFQLATLPGVTAPGGGVAVINLSTAPLGQLSTMQISAGVFGPVTASVPVTSSSTINSVVFTAMGNASGTPVVAGAGAPLGLTGVAKICLVFSNPLTCSAAVVVPLAPATGGRFGVGGVQQVPGAVAITMQHAAWTLGTPTMTIHSPGSTISVPTLPGGFAHGPATGGLSSAGQPSGVVQLVSITKTYTSLFGAFPELPLIGILQFQFVPEPGTLLLLGSGVVGLTIVGRKRSRK